MKPSNNFKVKLFTAFTLMLFFLCACGKGDEDAMAKNIQQVIRPIKAICLQSSNGQSSRIFPGTPKASQDTQLSFRVGGPLIMLNAETGQYIESNAVIAKIDPRDFDIQIKTLKARLDASKAQLSESRLQYKRYEQLIKENAAAKATYDQIKATFEMAGAQVRTDTENLKTAQNALKDTTLYAPFSGYVDKEFVENHQIVAAGQPVISMMDLSAIEMEVALPENMLPDIDCFESYICRFDALPGKTFSARFKEVGKQPNPSNHTYPLTLTIKDDESVLIRPGMSAEVTIGISLKEPKNFFIVPVSAVGNDHTRQSFTWIADPDTGKLTKKPVSVNGFAKDGNLKISGDIFAGQWMVVAGVNSLTKNQKIRLITSPSSTNVGNEL